MSSEIVQALSVRDLVRRRRGDDQDVWHLALVQRDQVWDQVRMRYLLDSLLEGYPIGSLLVCQVTGQSRVIRVEAGQRVVAEADRDSWQLLGRPAAHQRAVLAVHTEAATGVSTCT